MNINLNIPWSAAIAIAVGIVVLLGYFLVPADGGAGSLFVNLRDYFLQMGVILAAFALLVGILNLIRVHWQQVKTRKSHSLGSLILLIATGLTFALATVDYFLGNTSVPDASLAQYVFRYVQIPVERSLMALLAVALAYAVIRLFRRRLTIFTGVFLTVFFIVLIGTGLEIPYLSETIRPWIENVAALGGTRGLLLGVGLGALATGLRVLIGVDRPYGG